MATASKEDRTVEYERGYEHGVRAAQHAHDNKGAPPVTASESYNIGYRTGYHIAEQCLPNVYMSDK